MQLNGILRLENILIVRNRGASAVALRINDMRAM